jgi:hypothetical protein
MSRDVHSCTHWLRPRNPPIPAALGLVYEGAIGQIDDISLKPRAWLQLLTY